MNLKMDRKLKIACFSLILSMTVVLANISGVASVDAQAKAAWKSKYSSQIEKVSARASEGDQIYGKFIYLNGGIRSLEDMSLAMKYGADAVGLSRPLIRDPAWPDTLLLQGTSSSCLGCNSCYKLREKDQHRCVLN